MSFSLAVWLVSVLAEATAFGATFRRGLSHGLLWLRWYFFIALCGNATSQFFLFRAGINSHQYFYAYYLSDLIDSLLGFVVLARLVELAFEKSALKLPKLRLIAILLFTGVASCSAAVVYLTRGGFAHVALELDQNFAFLGMILAMILFASMNLMRVPGLRFRRVVLSFSVLYSSGAIAYSLVAIFPGTLHAIGTYVVPAICPAFVLLTAYYLWVPEPERRWEQKLAAVRAEQLQEVASW